MKIKYSPPHKKVGHNDEGGGGRGGLRNGLNLTAPVSAVSHQSEEQLEVGWIPLLREVR